MRKRLVATFLWFYAGWTFGAFAASVFGVSDVLGPIIGAAAAGLIVGDPRRIIWTARSATASPTTRESTPEPA